MATLRKFRSLEEINQYLTKETKVALEETLMALIPKLRYFIDEDIYWAYHPTFYKRTRWLKRRNDVIEHYISNLQGKLRGGVRIVDKIYNSVSDRSKFQHGNPYSDLSAENFLEILNDENFDCLFNPFGFPSLRRRPFWNDYLEWVKDNYADIFMKKCKKHKIDLTNIGSSENVFLDKPKLKESSPSPPATSVTDTSMDMGRTAIPQRKTGGINFEFGIRKFSSGSDGSIDTALKQLEMARSNRSMGIEEQRAKNAKDSAFGTWDDTN